MTEIIYLIVYLNFDTVLYYFVYHDVIFDHLIDDHMKTSHDCRDSVGRFRRTDAVSHDASSRASEAQPEQKSEIQVV